ncbi:serine protease SP24D [Stomoxys calcitrans]|uniref:serine protease SP24D n=1 Tax=Stomoxys calcitrans TaxID=35570 RepID=UPI0027E2B527|nr:serine protease SP24D [Stomoxys calcitrans]
MKVVTVICTLSLIAATWAAPQARIVGGDDAVPGQIPYQAALSVGGLYNCGAVILSERYALTSLLCVCSAGSDKPWPPQLFRVIAGTTDLYTGGSRITVEEITVNANYNDLTTGIALLKLSEPLVFSDYIKAIPLAESNPPVNADVEISGWGRTKEGEDDMHRALQINDATVTEAAECARTLGRADPDVICLGHPRKNGICRGDFGGPAVYEGKLVGIAASVVGECGSILPDVFTSVASNYEWIMQQMGL